MTDLTSRVQALPAASRERLLTRLRRATTAASDRGPVPRDDTGPVPLTREQRSRRALDGPDAVAPAFCLRLRGELDPAVLRSAVQAVVDRHDALRTVLVTREGKPAQLVVPTTVALPLTTASGSDHDERVSTARVRATDRPTARRAQAAITTSELIRIAPAEHLLVLDLPGLLCDDTSRELVVAEIAARYRSAPAARFRDQAGQYPDYARWQRARADAPGHGALIAHWRRELAGAEVLEFPTDRPRGERRSVAAGSAHHPVPGREVQRAADLARALGVARDDVLTAAFLVLLQRYSGLDDLVIATPDTTRPHPDLAATVGQFTELTVLRVDASGDPSFDTLVHRVASAAATARQHVGLALPDLIEAADPAPDPTRAPLFQFVFGCAEQAPAPDFGDLDATVEQLPVHTTAVDLDWRLVIGDDGRSVLRIDHNVDLFDAATVERLARHYAGLLGGLVANPGGRLSGVDVLDAGDRAFLDRIARGPQRPVRDTTIVAEFAARVRQDPDAVAVVVGAVETTYRELDGRSDRLAALLRSRGVAPGARVGLCLRRGLDLPTGVLAVLKAGAAYVPLDPGHPPMRIAGIVADADLRLVLAHRATAGATADSGADVLLLDDLLDDLDETDQPDPPGEDPVGGLPAPAPADIAYVIYTSGSTGRPKGVLLEHRGVVNFVDSCRELFELTPADRVLGFASATFDVSVFEMFSALLTGARLCLATDDERLSVDRLQELMERTGVTVIDLPPTVMPLLAPERFADLRIAFVGGEAFGAELVNRWNPGRRLFNGYGPTECTVTMIVEECSGTWDAAPPIGLPMTNHVAHVLDQNLRPVPIGVPGELVIGGAGLARGYLARPELTAEKFVDDPFGTAPGGRLYRTGDLVKRLADGRLTFLGRLDAQVKIRGLRIELGDVESALSGFPGVGQVSVRAWTDAAGDKHLVGYLTGVDEGVLPAVRDHAAGRLPAYMIPSFLVALPELPLTSSGKVDWRRLPAPETGSGAAHADPAATPTERRLLREVVDPLFHGQRLGVHDDFFHAGGNSLQAVQLMSAIRRRFGVEIALGDFFASPTVAHLAGIVDAADGVAPAAARTGTGAPAVQLRPGGPQRLVLVHPSGGELFCYHPLVRSLRPDIGVTGFAAEPVDLGVPESERLAAVASRIVDTLTAQPLPPVTCLAGWSYGGVLAFEVARQLEQATGQRPSLLLLDAAYDEDTEPLTGATIRRRFAHDLARLTGRHDSAVDAVLADPAPGSVGALLAGLGIDPGLSDAELESRFATFRSCAVSMQAYRPAGPYGGPVRLITAGPRPEVVEQWRRVCAGDFTAEDVPGDHYTLFGPTSIDRLASAVEHSLAP